VKIEDLLNEAGCNKYLGRMNKILRSFSVHLLSRLVAVILIFVGASNVLADVTLPALFSDHMVLQGGAAVPVWGWAEPGEEVTVTVQKQVRRAKADRNGKWMVTLGKLRSGTPVTFVVEGRNRIVVRDVLVGEVWLCSGQSNMEMAVDHCKDFEAEKSAANLPSLRMFTVARNSQAVAQTNCTGAWVICSPETMGKFSAVAYFFGREIQQRRHVPVGLIHSSWGGTSIEAWTSMAAQSHLAEFPIISERWRNVEGGIWDEAKAMAGYKAALEKWNSDVSKAKAEKKPLSREPQKPVNPRLDPNFPANLFNGMIAPLIPYRMQGAIWYQGENNAIASFPQLFGLQLRTMIKDWRGRWGYEFPFAWVQLPEWRESQKQPVQSTGWTTVREQMLKALDVPHTGMAVTLGLGDAKDIHPKNKQDVGKRLAGWALAEVYRDSTAVASGPLPGGAKIKGNEIIVSFKHTDGGLTSRGKELRGFVIASADRVWVRAEARIDGKRVIISHPGMEHPVAVRYAWADNPQFSLLNGAGIPASPFRTDDWKE